MSYRLPYGREVPPSTVDNHHAIFYRRWYKTPHEKLYRGLAGLVLPIHRPIHNQLHAEVPPPKPDPEQLHDLYQFMQEHNYDVENLDGLAWGIVWANDRRLYDIEENLDSQYHYLSGDYRR